MPKYYRSHVVEQQVEDTETRSVLSQLCTALGFGRLPWGAMKVVAQDTLDGKYDDEVKHYRRSYDTDLVEMASRGLDT